MKTRTPLALVLASSLTLIACGGDKDEQKDDITQGGDDCVSNREYFSKEVWKPVLEQNCMSCHNSSGQAKYTNLVFQPSSQTGHIEHNLGVFEKMAQYEASGKPLLLQKPIGELDHKGGPILSADSPEFKAISRMLERIESPVECADEPTLTEHFSSVTMLDDQQTLRKATLNLGGRLPTEEERALIESDGLEAMDQIVENLAKEDVFYERLETMFNDMFLTNRYVGGSSAVDLLDRDIFPEARWFQERDENDHSMEDPAEVEAAQKYANNAVAQAPLKLLSHLVREEKPFTELLTADYMMVNPFSARVYGITGVQFKDKLDPNEFKEARIPGQPHAGVLTDAMFLNRFPTTATNRNRHRSRMIYTFFLATDVMALAERPLDPTSIEDFNPTLYNPQCTSCHGVIDPVAGAYQNWNERGMYEPPENGWFEDMLPPGFGEAKISFEGRTTSMTWLAERFASDQRFATASVHNFYRGITGHDVIVPLDDDQEIFDNLLIAQEIQQEYFADLSKKFVDSNFNARVIISELIKSPYFRMANLPEPQDKSSYQYVEAGRGRLLTPEMLHRKIEAITGYPWVHRYNKSNRYLLRSSDYRILYGGMDSNDVTQRITEPNGIMANVQWRMANEMSCVATPYDFTLPIKERRFFPHVETNFVPEDGNGFLIQEAENAIKQNIQHLHWHILGERVTLDDPELERTYNLWYDTWKEGLAGIKAEEISSDLMGDCRAERDFFTGEDLPEEVRLRRDSTYTIRAWQAVITYMLADYNFLYE